MKYLLDTHTWIWWHTAAEKLPDEIKRAISDPDGQNSILLNAISVWELCKLVEKGRLILSISLDIWIEKALQMAGLFLVPLSPGLLIEASRLPGSFHADPADQIIAATAREYNAVLLTRDKHLQKYPHIRTSWN